MLINCSIVPVSHSRATVTLVSMAAITIITIATIPGRIMFWLRMSALYQTRGTRSTAPGAILPEAAVRREATAIFRL